MFKWLQKKKATQNDNEMTFESLAANLKRQKQDQAPTPARASNAYIGQVIQHTLYHAITNNTFVGSLNDDPDFNITTFPDGVAFASNIKESVGALQERISTGLMFAHVPVAHVAMVASPAAIEFNLRQQPNWTPSKTDEKGIITEFKTEIVIDQPAFTAKFSFSAAESNKVKIEPKGGYVPGTIMTISISGAKK